METSSLLDDEEQCRQTTDLTLHEMYKTRLVRIDQLPRTRQDPLQRSVHHLLRSFRYSRMSRSEDGNIESRTRFHPSMPKDRFASQNSTLLADIISRGVVAVFTAMFLVAPLVALSQETRKGVQIAIVSIFVVSFASLVSIALRASNLEMMIVSAAYAAIISVFVSNGPGSR